MVDLIIGGTTHWNVQGVQLSEDATPVDPSDLFAGVGEFRFEVPPRADPKLIVGAPALMDDPVLGEFKGVVSAVGFDEAGILTAACTTRLFPLVCDRNAAPHVGTIESYLSYVFGLCDVTTDIVFDPAVADTEVAALGWSGNVWSQVKKFCAAYEVEVAVVGTDIVVRHLRTETASRVGEEAFQWGMDGTGLAKTVTSWFYPCTEVTDALIVGRRHSYGTQFLEAGAVEEYTIDLDYSLSSVDQPVCLDSVSYGSNTASVYSVVDRWGDPVKASYWNDQGGNVEVSISDDSRSITVTITACLDLARAPYRLVGVRTYDGEEIDYPTLRVVGSGLAFERKFYSMHACTDGSATVEVGCEVDNDFITSFSQCHRLLLWSAVRYGSPTVRLTGKARLGAGAGARLYDDYAYHRVRTTSRDGSGVSGYEASPDTILDDVDAIWGTSTLDEFTAAHTTIRAFDARPLTE